MSKHATPDHPIHDLIVARWSPYVFDPKPVEREKLLACLEAARWAASSYNEQPWSFIIASREDEAAFNTMLGCLVEANQGWAQAAGVLLITTIGRTFSRNGSPNRAAEHDLGLAVGNLSLQATQLGLHVHEMAGIDLDKTREVYAIPGNTDPWTAIALGYVGDPASAPDLAPRDTAPRTRKALGEFVFAGEFGKSAV